MRVVFYADSGMSQFLGQDIENIIPHEMIESSSKESLTVAVTTTIKERFVRIAYILLSTSKFLTLVVKDLLDVWLLYEIKYELQFVKLVDTFLRAYTVDILHYLCACCKMMWVGKHIMIHLL